jgi:hypothetical protein
MFQSTEKASLKLLAAVLSLWCTCSLAAEYADYHYHARLNDDLSLMQVQACFAGSPPLRLRADHAEAYRYLHLPESTKNNDANLQFESKTLRVVSQAPGACVSYAVDLGAAVSQGRRAPVSRIGEDLRTDPRLWLWRPASGGQIDLQLSLPAGVAVSAPWQQLEGDRYLIDPAASSGLRAAVVFGQLEQFDIVVPGATLDVALLDGQPAAKLKEMRRWLSAAAAAVVAAYGRFPVPRVQVLIVPVNAGGWGDHEAVPFGRVLRGGGAAIELFVNTRRPIEEYLSDWTAAHELSHFFHPLLAQQDAWLAEGLASYYQNVLRARTGILSEQMAWQKLHEGFERGIAGTTGIPLNRVAANMHRDRTYMRVYWSGAAVALMADAELRISTDGRLSLDEALARFSRCCLPAERRWSGREFMAKLDELMDTQVFSALYLRYSVSPRFPDVASIYRPLGLVVDDAGQIRLREAEHAAVRDRIMRGSYSHSSSL